MKLKQFRAFLRELAFLLVLYVYVSLVIRQKRLGASK